jgi:hypothetical protein
MGLLYLLLNNIQFLRTIGHISLPRKEEQCSLLFMKPELLKKSAHFALHVSLHAKRPVVWTLSIFTSVQIHSVTSYYL